MSNKEKKSHITVLRAIIFLLILAFTGEIACRIKYYILHEGDIRYLLAPFMWEHKKSFENDPEIVEIGDVHEKKMIYSPCRDKTLVRSYNEYGWRGKNFSLSKPENVYRILVVGASTVASSNNPDMDTWVYQLEELLNFEPVLDRKYELINAGTSGYHSKHIGTLLRERGFNLKPDVILYYESIAEEVLVTPRWTDFRLKIDSYSKGLFGFLHKELYLSSMLYTYIIEKSTFMMLKPYIFRLDENLTRKYFLEIINDCRKKNIELVYVREVIDYPINKGGKDLTDISVLRKLLEEKYKIKIKKNPGNVEKLERHRYEMRALNQRLANEILTKICREQGIPVIDPLPAFDQARKQIDNLFMDLCHKTCYGEKALAELINQGLKDIIRKRSEKTPLFEPDLHKASILPDNKTDFKTGSI